MYVCEISFGPKNLKMTQRSPESVCQPARPARRQAAPTADLAGHQHVCTEYVRRLVRDEVAICLRRRRSSNCRRGAGSERTRRLYWKAEMQRRAAQAVASRRVVQVASPRVSPRLASFFSTWRSSVAGAVMVVAELTERSGRGAAQLRWWRLWRTCFSARAFSSGLDCHASPFELAPEEIICSHCPMPC